MDQQADRPTVSRRLNAGGVLSAALGLGLFVYFVHQAGLGQIAGGARKVGWGFLVILALAGLRHAVRALAWRRCIDAPDHLGFASAFQAVLVGDALGNLTPLGLLVSEPAKAVFVRDRVPLVRALSALAIENLFYTLSVFVVITCGLLALPLAVRLPEGWGLAGGFVILSLVALAWAIHLVLSRRMAFVRPTLAWLDRHGVSPASLRQRGPQLRAVESRIFDLYVRSRTILLPLALLESAFHAAGVAEAYVAMALISGAAPTLLEAFLLESTSRLITVAFKFVPLRIGVDEAGTGLLADLLRYGTAAGVTLAIVRKARILCWMTVGIMVLVRRGLSVQRIAEEAELTAVGRD